MNDLLEHVLNAHGGMEQWKQFNSLTATITTGGTLWGIKGLVQDAKPREMTISLHEERASVTPFGQAEWRTAFDPHRIAIETIHGQLLQERLNPRDSFSGHTKDSAWDPLHRAYFNGYALWTYLTTPFLLAMPGFKVVEIPSWREGNETWRGLRAEFPPHIASHNRFQDFYVGDDYLLRRHDYHVDIAGGFAAAQYVSDFIEVQGLRFPSARRAFLRADDLTPVRDQLLVSIDLSNFRLS